MADQISQADLDALWGSLSQDGGNGQATPKQEEASASAGISQADLDALWGDLGGAGGDGNGASSKAEEPAGGISQADLDALWGLAPKEGGSTEAPPPQPAASSGSENLSQEDIDRLLAEMGR